MAKPLPECILPTRIILTVLKILVTLYQSYSLNKSNSSADDNISNRPGNICKRIIFLKTPNAHPQLQKLMNRKHGKTVQPSRWLCLKRDIHRVIASVESALLFWVRYNHAASSTCQQFPSDLRADILVAPN